MKIIFQSHCFCVPRFLAQKIFIKYIHTITFNNLKKTHQNIYKYKLTQISNTHNIV